MPLPLSLQKKKKWVLGKTSLLVRGAWVSSMPGNSCKEARGMEFSCFHFGEVELRAGTSSNLQKMLGSKNVTNVHWGHLPRLFTKYICSLLPVLQTSGRDVQAFQSLSPPPSNLTYYSSSLSTSIPA